MKSLRTNNFRARKPHTVWGAGLLAVDLVIRSGDTDAFEITAGGTCANVLANLAHLGWNASAKGRIGKDPAGHTLEGQLADCGVDVASLVLDEKVQTPLIIERFGIGDQLMPTHRFEWRCPRCSKPVPKYRPTPIRILESEETAASLPELFFFDRPTPGNIRLARFLKERGTLIVFEPPRLRDEPEYIQSCGLADILKFADSKDLPRFENWLPRESLVIVTKGEQGLMYKSTNFSGLTTAWKNMPAISVSRTLDACGSGDWVTSGFLHAFFAIEDFAEETVRRLDNAIKFGQALASLNCLLPGARGLARVYERAEISEMAALVLADGLASAEGMVSERATVRGENRRFESACSGCLQVSQSSQ